MTTPYRHNHEGSTGFLLFVLVGGFVAAGLFLGVFILSSKADTPDPRANLRLQIPEPPQELPTSPRPRPTPAQPSTQPSPVVVTPPVETTPSASAQ